MQLRHEGILIRSLAWSADGKFLAGGDVDGMVVWWDSTTGERRGRYEGHLGCAHDVAFNQAGSVLASAGLDNTIRFWDLVNERPLFEIESWVSHICFTADDRRLGLAEEHRRPGWIEWSGSEVLWVRRYYTVYDWAPLLAFDSSDKLIACTSEAGLTFRDTRTGRDLGPLVFRRATGLSPRRASNEFIVADTNGVWRLALRNLANGGLEVAQRELFLTNSAWQDVSLITGGKLFMALNRRDEQVAVISMEDGQVQRRVTGRHFDSMAASPDGRFIFTSQWQPMRAEVWDAHTGTLLSELSIGQNWRGAFSPDGRWLATFSRDCQLWETGTWRPGPSVPLAGANRFATSQGVPLGGGAAFSPDGRLLAVVQDLREVRLFALPEGRVVATLPASGGARLQTLSFSNDGSMLAAATARGELHLWKLTTLRTRLAGLGLNW